jgi:hypothetical protein
MLRSNAAVALATAVAFFVSGHGAAAATDPAVLCHKTIVKQLEKYKKDYIKNHIKCLDKENTGDLAGPCPDALASAKIGITKFKVKANIAKKCGVAQLTTLGYRSDCAYGPATPGIGGTCAVKPVTTVDEFTDCMQCWKEAEFARFAATLYASHAQEICGTGLDETSPVCASLGCASPVPDQRDLGSGGEYDCQRFVAKAGLNYLRKREQTLEKCLLAGGTLESCLDDPKIQLKLAKAETQKETLIGKKCNNYDPTAAAPFCCRTTGNDCVLVPDRAACGPAGGTVQEGKTCDPGTLKCTNQPGGAKSLTWWDSCPTNDPCPGPTMNDDSDLSNCVDSVADTVVGNLLCLQFPNAGACPTLTPTPTPTATP